jgi:CubicO group peptidase (beta-lactamase class C family)
VILSCWFLRDIVVNLCHYMIHPCILALILLLLFPDAVRGGEMQTDPSTNHFRTVLNARIDALFAEWDKPDAPGCAVAVVKDGKVIHARGYGMANLEHGIPIRPGTVFDLASVSKQFTGMAAAMLVQEGKLTMDDNVRCYLPEMHDFGAPIQIRHLAHHSSGLWDWIGLTLLSGKPFGTLLAFEDLFQTAVRQRDLNFAPGADYLYSNTGYNLLAAIVQRVSNKPFPEFLHARIFQPLGMNSTRIWTDHEEIVPRRAHSYEPRQPAGFRQATSTVASMGSGAVLSTVEDLALWMINLQNRALGGSEVFRLMRQRGVLNDGRELDYAFGLVIRTDGPFALEEHTGRSAGFRTILRHYPDEKLGFVILANRGDFNSPMMADKLAALFLREPNPASPHSATDAPLDPVRIEPAALERFAGEYIDAQDTLYRLEKRGERLVIGISGLERNLIPTGPSEFAPEGWSFKLAFPDEENGPARRLLVRRAGVEAVAERLTRRRGGTEAHGGAYYSDVLDVIGRVLRKEGGLVWVQGGQESELYSLGPDIFVSLGNFGARRFKFERDEAGRISSVRMSNPLIRNLRFDRLSDPLTHGTSPGTHKSDGTSKQIDALLPAGTGTTLPGKRRRKGSY